MKSERRHAMETNWLADHVGECIKAIQPYSKAITGLVLAALVVCAALAIMAHRTAAEQAASWNTLWDGMLGGIDGQKSLTSLADSSARQAPTDWANLLIADSELNNGVSNWFTDKSAGRNLLKESLDRYETVYKNSTDPLIREHALYGVGRAEESLCKLDEARKAYEELRKDYPTGSYAMRAKQRLDSLARESTQARYDWFAQVEPASNVLKEGNKGLPVLPEELGPPSDFTTGKAKTPPPEPKPDTGAAKKPAATSSAPAKSAPATSTAPAKPAAPATNPKPADKSAAPATSGGKS